MEKAHILVVDDSRTVVQMLVGTLELADFKTSTALTAEDALHAVWKLHPDLIVLDEKLGGSLSGCDIIQRLRATGNDIPIIVITADPDLDVSEVLGTGGDDFIRKPFLGKELIARIEARLRDVSRRESRRGTSFHLPLLFEDIKLDEYTHRAWRGPRELALSSTEFNLLVCFLRHPDQVLTRDTITKHVWGYSYDGSSKNVDVYIGYLRDKLELDGEPRLLQTIRSVGYVLRNPNKEEK